MIGFLLRASTCGSWSSSSLAMGQLAAALLAGETRGRQGPGCGSFQRGPRVCCAVFEQARDVQCRLEQDHGHALGSDKEKRQSNESSATRLAASPTWRQPLPPCRRRQATPCLPRRPTTSSTWSPGTSPRPSSDLKDEGLLVFSLQVNSPPCVAGRCLERRCQRAVPTEHQRQSNTENV